jgi:hypothetical protein
MLLLNSSCLCSTNEFAVRSQPFDDNHCYSSSEISEVPGSVAIVVGSPLACPTLGAIPLAVYCSNPVTTASCVIVTTNAIRGAVDSGNCAVILLTRTAVTPPQASRVKLISPALHTTPVMGPCLVVIRNTAESSEDANSSSRTSAMGRPGRPETRLPRFLL